MPVTAHYAQAGDGEGPSDEDLTIAEKPMQFARMQLPVQGDLESSASAPSSTKTTPRLPVSDARSRDWNEEYQVRGV